MTPAPILTLQDAADDELRTLIVAGLDAYNDAAVGYTDRRPLAIRVTDPATGVLLGGLSGRSSLGTLFIDLVYLPETLRGQDVGSALLAMAEAEGRRRGCRSGVLFTLSLQAPGFYEKRGWVRFGEIACDPPGASRVFFSKTFAAD